MVKPKTGTVHKKRSSQDSIVTLSWSKKDMIIPGGDHISPSRHLDAVSDALAIEDLFSAKAFVDFKRHTKDKTANAEKLSEDDNYIIHGDNLPVLHSLKQKFKGSIKLIYIDPPYNTESNSFHYHDNYGQDTWLAFMKNRLDVAKELLSVGGFMFVHISFHQYAYLKVLLDELFNGNHVCTFNLLVRHPDRILKGDKDFHDVMEYLLVYTVDKTVNKLAKRKQQTDKDAYIYSIREKTEGDYIKLNGEKVQCFEPGDYEVIKHDNSCGDLQKISIRGSLKEGNSSGRFYEKHIAPMQHRFLPGTLFKVPGIGNDKFDHRYFYTPSAGRNNGGYYQGVPVNASEFKFKPYPNFIDFVQEFNQVGYEGGVQFRNGKKPEALLKWIFELAQLKKGDRVLDFFLGSGTTAAVAHKMGFKYIGVEQTNWGVNDPLNRLASVIKGENGGVSIKTGWKGGGSFVSMRLLDVCDLMADGVKKASSIKEIKMLFNAHQKKHTGLFSPEMVSHFTILVSTPSKELDLRKDELIKLLRSEPWYVNFSDLNKYSFSDKESLKKMNRFFYK